jgi:hypothetical protein
MKPTYPNKFWTARLPTQTGGFHVNSLPYAIQIASKSLHNFADFSNITTMQYLFPQKRKFKEGGDLFLSRDLYLRVDYVKQQ